MPGKGAKNGIMFIGENPGSEEDEKGEPFVGSAGKYLRALLEDAGLMKVAFLTNATRCKGSSIKRKPTIKELRTCREYIDKEIESINPKVIVALGEHAGQSLTDSPSFRVTKFRGTTSTYKGIPVFFTFHPSAIHYDKSVVGYMEEDLKKIRRMFEDGPAVVFKRKKFVIKKWEDLSVWETGKHSLKFLSAAVDIETNSLDPYAPGSRVMSIAAAISDQVCYYKYLNMTIPQFIKSGLLEYLKPFSSIITHNGIFDMGWLTYTPKKNPETKPYLYSPTHWIWNKNWEDTLVTLQFHNEFYPNTSLKHLAVVYAGMKPYSTPEFVKGGFPQGWDTKKNYQRLKIYNCKDAIATFRIRKALYPRMRDVRGIGSSRAYMWVCNNLKIAVKMRHAGIRIHTKRLNTLYDHLTGVMEKNEKVLSRKVDIHKTKDLKDYLFNVLKLPVVKRTPTGQPSLDKEAFELLTAEVDSPFLRRYKEYESARQQRNTYCENIKLWGRIARPVVRIARQDDKESGDKGGANTGRVTTKGWSNLPKTKEGEKPTDTVKGCIVSRYGKEGIIVSIDYSQIEMRIMANESKDAKLIEAFEKGLDLHTYVASKVCRVKYKKVDKNQRFRAKAVNFGIIYGIGPKKLSKQIKSTQQVAQEFMDGYLRKFPGVDNYMFTQQRQAIKHKIVYSPIGRPFHLVNADNEYSKDARKAINSPIQDAANNFTNEAIRRVQKFIEEGGYRASVVLTVYDSLIIDWHKEDMKKARFLEKKILDRLLVEEPKQTFKELGWIVTVPIEYDVSTGFSYGDCK